MSRLASITNVSVTYASYKYLGASRIVVEDYEEEAGKWGGKVGSGRR